MCVRDGSGGRKKRREKDSYEERENLRSCDMETILSNMIDIVL